jgi:hypothetical protein
MYPASLDSSQAINVQVEEVSGAMGIKVEEVSDAMGIKVEEVSDAMGIKVEEASDAMGIKVEEVSDAMGVKVEEVSDVEEEEDPVPITFTKIKAEPEVSCMSLYVHFKISVAVSGLHLNGLQELYTVDWILRSFLKTLVVFLLLVMYHLNFLLNRSVIGEIKYCVIDCLRGI